ncbi:MAG TPA: hypothetical protein VIV14_07630 [Gammaproteobacteria bacterium]
MRISILALVLTTALCASGNAAAQGMGAAPEMRSGREAAAQDLTGNWVAVVTEYWHLRMLMPPKGAYNMLPLTAEARRMADAWNPGNDAGNECRSYGAASIMRLPGRLQIEWEDEETLRIDIDSGTQTRLLHFDDAAVGAPSWQGHSVASWEGQSGNEEGRYLKVTTTNMLPGYLRKNGVPYSGNAVLEEHFDVFTEPNGDRWMVVTSIITDPQYLTRPYAVTNHFRQEDDDDGWDPTRCRVDHPR